MQFDLPFDDPGPVPAPAVVPVAVPAPMPPAPAPTAVNPGTDGAPLAMVGTVYFVRNRRARRYILRVDLDGRVRVTIPRGGSKRDGSAFAITQRQWIQRQRSRLGPPAVAPADAAAARARAAMELPARLLTLADVHGLAVARVSIRNQRTRWGSCGPDGHVSLNWRLVLMPEWVRDYVLIHELMHLKQQNHSRRYWRLVEAACPDYRVARRWLRLHGRSLR